jgi:hypothetical protein
MNPFIQLKTIVVVFVLLAWAGIAGAQSFPRLSPLPPKKDARVFKATPALAPGSPWQLLTNQPPVLDYTNCGPGNPILLTDGTVMLADNGCQDWWKLTPDEFGSYVNGTWTQLASLPDGYSPLYHASAVLPDGRVIIEGGEYIFSNGVFNPVWSDQGAIYDPRADTWTSVAPPPFFGGFGPFPRTIGDAQSVVLFDGTFMLADALTRDTALLDARTLTWTPTGENKFDVHDEEGWTLLPNKKVLTVDAYVFQYDPTGMNFELYNPASRRGHGGATLGLRSRLRRTPFRLIRGGARGLDERWERLRHRSQCLRRRPHRDFQGKLESGSGFPGLFRYLRRACGTGAERQGSYDGEPIYLPNPVDVLGVGRSEPDGNFPSSERFQRLVLLRQHASPPDRPDSFHRLLLRLGLQSHWNLRSGLGTTDPVCPCQGEPRRIVCHLRPSFQWHVARGCLRGRSAIGNELSARAHHQQCNWTRIL